MSGPGAPDMGEVLFALPKPGGRTFRLAIRDYRGRRFLDAREWGERDGLPLATGKGATLPLEGLEALTDALLARRARNGSGGHSGPS